MTKEIRSWRFFLRWMVKRDYTMLVRGPIRLPGNQRQKEKVNIHFRFRAPPYICYNRPLKPETRKQANYFLSTQMTTISPLGKCYDRRNLARESPMKRTWTELSLVQLLLMASSRSVVSQYVSICYSWQFAIDGDHLAPSAEKKLTVEW